MEIIRNKEAHRVESGMTCVAHEYHTQSPNLNVARVEIAGRYPSHGYVLNREVEEVVYVESGSGEIQIGGERHPVCSGDVIHIKPGVKIAWQGICTLVISCAPAWNPEQYEIVG